MTSELITCLLTFYIVVVLILQKTKIVSPLNSVQVMNKFAQGQKKIYNNLTSGHIKTTNSIPILLLFKAADF